MRPRRSVERGQGNEARLAGTFDGEIHQIRRSNVNRLPQRGFGTRVGIHTQPDSPLLNEQDLHILKILESAPHASLEILRVQAIQDQETRHRFIADQAIDQPGARFAVARRHFHHALETSRIQFHDGRYQFLGGGLHRWIGNAFQFGDQRINTPYPLLKRSILHGG